MVGTRLNAWRARPRRARVADAALVGVLALIAIAVVANVQPTVRDTLRGRVDKRVMFAYLAAHPALGSFGTPITKAHPRLDDACAYRHGARDSGFCLKILSATNRTDTVVRAYTCTRPPPDPRPPAPPGQTWCALTPKKEV